MDLTQEIDRVQGELDKLKAKHEEQQRLKEVGTGDWVPENGYRYSYLLSSGEVSSCTHTRTTNFHGQRIALGNCYPDTPASRKHLEHVVELKKRFRQRVKEVNQGTVQDDHSVFYVSKGNMTPHRVGSWDKVFIVIPSWMQIHTRAAAYELAKEFTPQDMQDIYESLR